MRFQQHTHALDDFTEAGGRQTERRLPRLETDEFSVSIIENGTKLGDMIARIAVP